MLASEWLTLNSGVMLASDGFRPGCSAGRIMCPPNTSLSHLTVKPRIMSLKEGTNLPAVPNQVVRGCVLDSARVQKQEIAYICAIKGRNVLKMAFLGEIG